MYPVNLKRLNKLIVDVLYYKYMPGISDFRGLGIWKDVFFDNVLSHINIPICGSERDVEKLVKLELFDMLQLNDGYNIGDCVYLTHRCLDRIRYEDRLYKIVDHKFGSLHFNSPLRLCAYTIDLSNGNGGVCRHDIDLTDVDSIKTNRIKNIDDILS